MLMTLLTQLLSKMTRSVSLGILWILSVSVALEAQETGFGGSSGEEGALIGILYDLKQNQKGEPSNVNEENYRDVIEKFLASEWDEHILNQYFRVSRPLYATRICLPMIQASQAPESFGVADVVEPRLWVVHYKGQVVAPMDGVFRLAGYADDLIAARINGETILVHGRSGAMPRDIRWESSEAFGIRVGNGRLRYGDWISLNEGEVIDLDVLVGERPGGGFGAWLYIERQGESYPQRGRYPVLPLFQLSDDRVESNQWFKVSPPRESSVWKALR